MIKTVYIFFFLFLISECIVGQPALQNLEELEITLVDGLHAIRNEKDKSKRDDLNQLFEENLRKTLFIDEAFDYKFDSLSKLMSTVKSPDGAFRLFNWNIELDQYQRQKYHCLIMKKDPRKDGFIIIELWDRSDKAIKEEYAQYSEKKWYGAMYYAIIPVRKGGRTIYTLLGWDGNDMLSNKKLIETMTFSGKDKIKFGAPLFKYEKDIKRRVIFQYNKQSYMSLKYKETKKTQMIIFDHLSPTSPQLEGMKDWYVTDLSFDAFIFENGKWNYTRDVDARTGKKFKTKYNAPPEK